MENLQTATQVASGILIALVLFGILIWIINKNQHCENEDNQASDWIGNADWSQLFEDKDVPTQKYINVEQISSIEIMDDLKIASDKYDEEQDKFFCLVRDDKKHYFNEKSGRYYREGNILYYCISLEFTMTNKERHYKYFTSHEEAVRFADITLIEQPHIIL